MIPRWTLRLALAAVVALAVPLVLPSPNTEDAAPVIVTNPQMPMPRADREWQRPTLAGVGVVTPTATPPSGPSPVAQGSEAALPPTPAGPTEQQETALGIQRVTAYCWTGNRTASGAWPELGHIATLDRSIPFGAVVRIDGLGEYVVTDRIGHGSDLDIFMGRDGCQSAARKFGFQRLPAYLIGETK